MFFYKGANNVRLIENKEELFANIRILDKYLADKTEPFYEFALNLIKKGICFVVIKEKNSYRFYPSRFIGYYNNSMDAHLNNPLKSGIDTNQVISEILGSKPKVNPELDKHYQEFCESLGLVISDKSSFGVERSIGRL